MPPMTGSEILAWKAEIETNITVLVKVEKMCEQMTVRRYHDCTPLLGNIMTTDWEISAATRRPTKA